MASRSFVAVGILTTLCAPGAAQAPALVSPPAATAAMGRNATTLPFANGAIAYQQVHSRTSFSSLQPTVLTQMRFRMGGGHANEPGFLIDVELHLGTALVDAAGAGPTFAGNVQLPSEVNVFPRQMVNLPQVPHNGWSVGPFPFTAPYFWPSSHLSWRALVWNGPAAAYALDLWTDGPSGAFYGPSCGVTIFSGFVSSLTGTLELLAMPYLPTSNQKALVMLGLSKTQWGGVPLPLSLAPWGAPGCSLYTDMVATLPTTTNAAGWVQMSLPIPGLQGLGGQTLYAQAGFVDPSANALGIALSNGLQWTFAVPQITVIMAPGQPQATTGTLLPGAGVAVGFN